MATPGAKVGPLTQQDLQTIWEGAVDDEFSQGLEAAGEGQGFEAYTQMFAQMARASAGADTTFQAMYILSWSGQSAPPASGGAQATVSLSIARSGVMYIAQPMVLVAGTFVDEQQNDWGTNGSTPVLTGRRYALSSTLVFPPGDSGPHVVTATAELPGYGYNNPLPGSIQVVDQPGTGYSNVGASVVVSPAGAPFPALAPPSPEPSPVVVTIVAANVADMFLAQHVGQYVALTAGSNAGNIGRIVAYLAPGVAGAGSAVQVAWELSVELSTPSAALIPGEQVYVTSGGSAVATGALVGFQPGVGSAVRACFVLQASASAVATGQTLTGLTSGGVATVTHVLTSPAWANETGTASWRVLDWALDLSATVTNPLSPQGGKLGMLDELGYERNVRRALNEPDSTYRLRVAAVADTVSPDALRRAITRALGGSLGCFRDTQAGLTGFFYDRTGDAMGDFYDTNCLIFDVGAWNPSPAPIGTPARWIDANGLLVAQGFYGGVIPSTTRVVFVMRGGPLNVGPVRTTWATGDTIATNAASAPMTAVTVPACRNGMRMSLYLDYTSFRGYFLAGLPPSSLGEPGFCWDTNPASHVGGFYDQRGSNMGFYDGQPFGAEQVWTNVWASLNQKRAGGVAFDVYIEAIGCP